MSLEADDQDELRRLWTDGEPLSVAWVVFSGDDDPETLEAIRSGQLPQDDARLGRARAECLKRLRSVELLAIGTVQSVFGGSERRAQVRALACRDGFVDWNARKISDGATSYWNVRVVESDDRPSAPSHEAASSEYSSDECAEAWEEFLAFYNTKKAEEQLQRKRKSFSADFLAAIRSILIDDRRRIDRGKQGAAIKAIKEKIVSQEPEKFKNDPPRDETIRKFLKRYGPPWFDN